MANITLPTKSVAINPLKQSQPLGASLAFLGLKGTIPLLHGSQGCTAFAKVLLVRHFREAIPLSTTAMTEVSTILGGEDNIEQAIKTLLDKSKPEIIALCTTALTETRGDDMDGILKDMRKRHPEWGKLPIISVSTPDFRGSLQDGFAAAVEGIVSEIPQPNKPNCDRVNILIGSAFTPGDVQEIEEIVNSFGLTPIILPNIGASLDGHLEDSFKATTTNGTTLEELKQMGSSVFTIAIGESMRSAAEILNQRCGIPYEIFSYLTGLDTVDNFLQLLMDLSGVKVPDKYCRQRRQLLDTMLDTHFFFARKRIAIASDPDLLWSNVQFLLSMGTEIHAAVTTTKSPLLAQLPINNVTIGDLDDFEQLSKGADLLITNSHGKAIGRRLGIPLYRQGFPIFDRVGNGQLSKVGYRGTIQTLLDIGNIFIEQEESH